MSVPHAISATITVAGLLLAGSVVASAAALEELAKLRAGNAGAELAGVVIATADRRGQVWSLATGCARFAADGRVCIEPLRSDGLLRIASISKLVTAAEVHRLARQGALRLQDDAATHLGFALQYPGVATGRITVRRLLEHRSSIVDSEQYWLPWPGRLAVDGAGTHRFDTEHAPGKFFRYANFNYVLLGQIVENVSAERFDQAMAHNQFAPLALTAGFNWSAMPAFDARRVVTLYRRQAVDGAWLPQGPWVPQVDDLQGAAPMPPEPAGYRVGDNASVFSPHGGLRISVPELARWFASLDLRLFDAMRLRATLLDLDGRRGDTEGGFYRRFGAGMQGFDWPGIGRVWGHFGEAYGLRSALLRDPRSGHVWAYAITGYGSDPDALPSSLPGLDRPQAELLGLLARLPPVPDMR